MGCDGGTIPKRIELVKEKKKAETADKNIVSDTKWNYCSLSKKPLEPPLMADLAGKLYNREAILEYLLDKSSYGDADILCPHIKSLKDLTLLKITQGQSASPSGASDKNEPRIICPITMREMNGKSNFIFSKSCGCVISEAAIKEMGRECCLQCNQKTVESDFVKINPPKEEQDSILETLLLKRTRKKRNAADAEDAENKKQKRGPDVALVASSILKNYGPSKEVATSKAIKELYSSGEKSDARTGLLYKSTFNRYA